MLQINKVHFAPSVFLSVQTQVNTKYPWKTLIWKIYDGMHKTTIFLLLYLLKSIYVFIFHYLYSFCQFVNLSILNIKTQVALVHSRVKHCVCVQDPPASWPSLLLSGLIKSEGQITLPGLGKQGDCPPLNDIMWEDTFLH